MARAVLNESASTPWPRFAALAVLLAAVYVVAVGIVTGVVPNPVFERVLRADAWNVVALVVPGALFGPLVATYLVPWPQACRVGGRAGAGGALSYLAAGCPVCNKLVVAAVGTTGAVDYFRPMQPLLGLLSIGLLGVGLRARWRTRAQAPVVPGTGTDPQPVGH